MSNLLYNSLTILHLPFAVFKPVKIFRQLRLFKDFQHSFKTVCQLNILQVRTINPEDLSLI
ncbi:hypothetical protein [Streptococcus suis]|uniref:hypothetical protein n=1 Tax=Streptococcus suis TaxID=1307 RepID=UPI003AF2AED4